jgi:tryptophanyl-tRNA synthetase
VPIRLSILSSVERSLPASITYINRLYFHSRIHYYVSLGPVAALVFTYYTLSKAPAKKVMSLREPQLKMSKSHVDPKSRILITDPPEEIAHKIRKAVTDTVEGISYDPNHRPGVSNLIDIISHFQSERSPEEIALEYANMGMRDFKEKVTGCVIENLSDIREKYKDILNKDDGRYVQDVACLGAEKARSRADETMVLVREALGL